MPDNRDPVLSPVPIHSLRPTQITVGLIEVEARRKRWDELSHRKAEYLGQHMIPVVIGPKHRPYVIEALEDEGQKNVLIQPIAHLEKLSGAFLALPRQPGTAPSVRRAWRSPALFGDPEENRRA